MDLTLGVRQERHLMRQRGAGARSIQGNFGFVFKAGSIPVSMPSQPPPTSQEPLDDVVGLSRSIKDNVIANPVSEKDAPTETPAKDIVPVEQVNEQQVQEPAVTKPKRKAPKKRKALFTKKKPAKPRATKPKNVESEPDAKDEPGTLEVVNKHNDHDEEDELSFQRESTTLAQIKKVVKTKTQTIEPVVPPPKKRRTATAEPVVVEEKKTGLKSAVDEVSTRPISRTEKRVTKEHDEGKTPQSKAEPKRRTRSAAVKLTSPEHHIDAAGVGTCEPLQTKKRASRLAKKSILEIEVPAVEDGEVHQAVNPKTKAPTLIKRKRGKNDTTLQEGSDAPAIEEAVVPPKKLVKKAGRARKDVAINEPLAAQNVDENLGVASPIDDLPLKRRSVSRATQSKAEEEESWFKRGSGRKRKPLAEQQVNTSSPKKTSSPEKHDLSVKTVKPHAAKSKKAVSSNSTDTCFPDKEIEDGTGAHEPSKSDKPVKRTKKETTRKVTAATTTIHRVECKESDPDADLFAPIKTRVPPATTAAIPKTSATRSAPRKRLPVPRNEEQEEEEDVDFSGLLDGIAAIAASSGR